MEERTRKKNPRTRIWIMSTVIAFIFALGGFFIINALISGDDTKRERQIQMISLISPPPPPEIEETPPEPEVEEEIIEPEPEAASDEMLSEGEEMNDPGESLGLDMDASAGSDGFNLVSKKGGRALIGEGEGNSALLRKYAWYTRMIQDRIRENLRKELEKKGGIPDGSLEAVVRIILDEMGQIKAHKIVGSSGSSKMDDAIELALRGIDIDMPPPYDMPKSIKIKVSSKG